MSTPATFSYAQAAKGQSAATAPASQPSPAASQTTPSNPPQAREGTAAATSADTTVISSSTTSNDSNPTEPKNTSDQPAVPSTGSKSEQNGVSTSEDVKAATAQNAEKSAETDSTQQASDRRGRGSAPSSRSQESSDTRKPKKGRKGKSTDKDSEAEQEKKEEPQPKVELSEAPIPSVNIWQQRLGEQATKSKPVAPPRPVTGTNTSGESASNKAKASNTGEADAASGNARHASNGNRSQRKGVDSSRNNDEGGPRRGAPRGSRVHERDERSSLPSISNAASWPTPETAATAEVKTSTPSEKDDKDDANANKTEKKKWIAVPFVPTAKFNTPIPGRGAPRSSRGGSRASRDAPTRSSQSNAASGTNGRPQESGPASRPSEATKAPSTTDSATPQETRKASATGEAVKDPGEPSVPTSRPESAKPSQATPETTNTERPTASRPAEANKATESVKESAPSHHRESHHGPNGTGHRSGDRPRGGRGGRGGHNANGSSHQNQASYGHNGSGYSFHSSSRQASQQAGSGYPQMSYSANFSASSGTNHRGRPNSVSLGRSQTNGNGRHNSARLPHIQPPQAMPYDGQIYPQTAIPYEYFSANVLALVQTQVEYYFSVDNLCKDYFLRKNMDSQGYVLLGVIANFRRMKEMTTDYDMIRAACDESREVELVYGDDGQDRVRRATGWESWVIQDISDRELSAQNDGPQAVFRHNRPFYPQFHPQMMHGGFMPALPAMFSPNGTSLGFVPYMNGNHMGYPMTNGTSSHATAHTDSQLSAAVPEFAPSGFMAAHEQGAPDVTKKGAPLPRGAAQAGSVDSQGVSANGTSSVVQGH